ncbi:uncharacterized protein K02A2.6-like [Octopus bimaculoides]|uniref:uncharacterized protein K02A2.6-like n=1 Tax=Octopus bimaculoides TaxID=37653 RepID=UPI00071C6440|nr:uncharacterized protein K02A2.6-like [Octopus bimaculoides]|eukprot:XP_014776959.1 PREDICTED: uncharacterized protein K02A2.6-like [Octopus bimaculoides]
MITPFGLYEFLCTLFHLKNTAQSFHLMNTVCRGLDFVFAYLDDILITSQNAELHKKHLMTLFDRLEQYGLVINPAKYVFGVTEIDFLGHRITDADATPLLEKVKSYHVFPHPTTSKALHKGMVNFYHFFHPFCSKSDETPIQGTVKRWLKKQVKWDGAMISAFKSTKQALAKAIMLSHLHLSAWTALTVDDPDTAFGGILEQHINSQW